MIALLQRVSEASVIVKDRDDERQAGQIDRGLLALVAVERGDTENQADRLLERMLALRVFDDDQGRMNLDLRQIGGGLLLVSQFTLAADTRRGNRPGFDRAAPPDDARKLYAYLLSTARLAWTPCAAGEFGAHMMVRLVNDGPVTFRLRVPPPDSV